MECPSCTFQNTPGTQVCVRCASRLDLDAVGFIPPRASSGRAGRRTRAAVQSARYSFVSGFGDVGRALRAPATSGMTWGQMLSAIVPGLPQILARAVGLRVLGWLVLSCWGLLLLLSLGTVGSGYSRFFGFASVSVHCFSISLLLTPQLQGRSLPFRLVAGMGVYAAVLFGVYWPIARGLQRAAGVLPINSLRDQQVLANGDVLLYTGPWTRPSSWRRGDLVVAEIGPASFGHAYIRAGLNVDRIVAVEGDTVRIDKGVLTINGEAPAPGLGPIGSIRNCPDLKLEVPEGAYVVLPSTLAWVNVPNSPALSAEMFNAVAELTEDAIRGRVIMRVRPWARLGFPNGERP